MTRRKNFVTTLAGSWPARTRNALVRCESIFGQMDAGESAGQQWPAAVVAMVGAGDRPALPGEPLKWACFPSAATHRPSIEAKTVRAARDFTITTCERWGVTGRCDDIGVVVSELLTNAVRHAPARSAHGGDGWPIRLGLLQPGPCVLCAVADPSPGLPVPEPPGCLAETGRGLTIVAALSDQWGYTAYTKPGDQGKVVWAMFLTDHAPDLRMTRPRDGR